MASNNLADLIEEINRNFGQETEDPTQDTPLDEEDEKDLTGLDDDAILAESKKVSIFCRNCLSPYYGEKGQGGSIILRCEKCYHRDVVTEDDLQETTRDHTESLEKGGNLILNRFSKVLLDNNELQNIDVDDPNFMEDEFKQISQTLPYITGTMKQTFSDMHKVTDDHRKVHNTEMLKILAEEGKLEENIADDGSKSTKLSVPTYGSEGSDDLVILPEKYKLPEAATEAIQMIAKRGIQKVDKYILNVGLTTEQIQRLPLFQKRLVSYCMFTQSSKCAQPDGANYHIEGHVKTNVEEINNRVYNINLSADLDEKNLDQCRKTHAYTKESNETLRTEADQSALSDSQTESSCVSYNATNFIIPFEQGQVFAQNAEDSTPQIGRLENTESAIMPSVTSNEKHDKSEDVEEIHHVQPEVCSESEILDTGCIQKAKCDNLDSSDQNDENDSDSAEPVGEFIPELDEFSNILYSIQEQNKVAKAIPVDSVVFDDSRPFTYVEAHEAFKEITTSMVKRATSAKAQRMLNTMALIKRAARSMSEQVDRVQDEMLKELQIAYRSKRIKAEKQKKRLEEAQETLEYYRGLLAHYQQTGEVDKIFEILQILREYNNLN